MQYNGLFGCNFCEQPGCMLRTEKGGNVHLFLYDVESPIRTHDSHMKHSRKAIEQSTVVCMHTYILQTVNMKKLMIV